MATALALPTPGTSVTTLPSVLKLVSRSPGAACATLTRPSSTQSKKSVLMMDPRSSGRASPRARGKRLWGRDVYGARPLLGVDDPTAVTHARVGFRDGRARME